MRAHRAQRGWTIEEMAGRLLCNPRTYSSLEAGAPTVATGVLMSALWVLGELDSVSRVAPAPVGPAAQRRVRRKANAKSGVISDDERNF